jgi:hypothetical protein
MHSLAALAPRFAALPLPTQALLTFALLLALALLAGALPARSLAAWGASWAGWTPQGRAVAPPRRAARPRMAAA